MQFTNPPLKSSFNRLRRLSGVPFLAAVSICWSSSCCGADATSNAPIEQKRSDLLCGVKQAIGYSGFRHGQRPNQNDPALSPTDAQILEDLHLLSRNGNFPLLRTYDSKANSETVLRLIQTHKLRMQVLLGAWLDAEISNTNCPWMKTPLPQEVLDANKVHNAQEIESAIRLAKNYPQIVAAVSVGNEALVSWNDHMVPVESMIQYVRHVKRSIKQPVTVADNYEWWAKHGAELARELDFVSVHIYPVWEGKGIDEAMSFGIANLQAVRNALPRSRLVITEAGWATVASEFGARASEENQQRYFEDLYAWTGQMNLTTFFFEAFDEDWKGNPADPLGAEKHWGLFTIDRKPKLALRDL